MPRGSGSSRRMTAPADKLGVALCRCSDRRSSTPSRANSSCGRDPVDDSVDRRSPEHRRRRFRFSLAVSRVARENGNGHGWGARPTRRRGKDRERKKTASQKRNTRRRVRKSECHCRNLRTLTSSWLVPPSPWSQALPPTTRAPLSHAHVYTLCAPLPSVSLSSPSHLCLLLRDSLPAYLASSFPLCLPLPVSPPPVGLSLSLAVGLFSPRLVTP